MNTSEKTGGIQSIERAVAILTCFEHHKELGVTEISRQVGLHKSTAYTLISTLASCGLLEHDAATGRYRLGLTLLRLGLRVDRSLRDVARPYLERLAEQYQETANLVVRESGNMVYIEKCESPRAMRIATTCGQALPMYCTAAGKAILAHLPPELLALLLSQYQFVPYTDRTLQSEVQVRQALEEVRRLGYAVDDEELEYGRMCIGVPILDARGEPLAALSVSIPKFRADSATQAGIIRTLQVYAREIQGQLSS